MDALLGNYLTAISVIIVYHLFSLQQWLARVADLESESVELKRAVGIADISRERLRTRCARTFKQFPWLHIVLLFIAITSLSYLAIKVALSLANIPRKYSMGPTFVLWSVFVSATAGSWHQGRSMIRRIVSGL